MWIFPGIFDFWDSKSRFEFVLKWFENFTECLFEFRIFTGLQTPNFCFWSDVWIFPEFLMFRTRNLDLTESARIPDFQGIAFWTPHFFMIRCVNFCRVLDFWDSKSKPEFAKFSGSFLVQIPNFHWIALWTPNFFRDLRFEFFSGMNTAFLNLSSWFFQDRDPNFSLALLKVAKCSRSFLCRSPTENTVRHKCWGVGRV